jgi:hypothetical protein
MKKLFLSDVAALLLATGTAHAQSSGPANAFFGGLGSPGIYGGGGSYQPPPQTARQKAATKRAIDMYRRGQLSKPRPAGCYYVDGTRC